MARSAPRQLTRLPTWAGVALIGGGFAALAFWFAPGERRDNDELPPELAAEPDVYVKEGDIAQLRADGSLHYRLRAARLSHFGPRFERGAVTRLEAPTLALYDPPAPPWRMSARTGEAVQADAGDAAQRMTFRGDVRLRQEDARWFVEVTTERLVVYPQRGLARSGSPVMIVSPMRRATAASLEADLASGRMTLVSSPQQRVAIVVEPP